MKAVAEIERMMESPIKIKESLWYKEDKEKTFAKSPFSHVDFLLYNSLTKQPISAIEVDGWHFHKENDAQQSRDALKNQIFTKLGLHLLRISTTDTVNQETIKKSLLAIL